MNCNKFLQSKILKIALIFVAALIVFLLIFKLGVFVGYKKANYSYRWGEFYHRNFAGPRGGFFQEMKRGFGEKDFINGHGAFGQIIKIDDSTIVIKGESDVEKVIITTDKTKIQSRRETVKASDLKIDDRIVVIGSPNEQGQIEAKLIRLFR